MASSFPSAHVNKDWKTRDWEFMQDIRDQQSNICDRIVQKRNQRVVIERNLSAIIAEIRDLEDRHSALEAEACRIGKRIYAEPSSAGLPALFNDSRWYSLSRNQTIRNKRATIEAGSQRVCDYLIYRPIPSSPQRTSPTTKIFPTNDISGTRTLVERQEETPSVDYVSFPSTPYSPDGENYYYDESPRNSESKSGTPFAKAFRKRAYSLRSGIASRLPFASSPAGSNNSSPQAEETPNRASEAPRKDRKSPKSF